MNQSCFTLELKLKASVPIPIADLKVENKNILICKTRDNKVYILYKYNRMSSKWKNQCVKYSRSRKSSKLNLKKILYGDNVYINIHEINMGNDNDS